MDLLFELCKAEVRKLNIKLEKTSGIFIHYIYVLMKPSIEKIVSVLRDSGTYMYIV